jgi:hypothetical protein
MSAAHVAEHQAGWLGWRLRILICGIGGHELLRSFEPGRVCLRCTSCLYETPGWTLRASRQPADPRPRALVTQNAR